MVRIYRVPKDTQDLGEWLDHKFGDEEVMLFRGPLSRLNDDELKAHLECQSRHDDEHASEAAQRALDGVLPIVVHSGPTAGVLLTTNIEFQPDPRCVQNRLRRNRAMAGRQA